MKHRVLVSLICLAALLTSAFPDAVGTVTVARASQRGVERITATWTSDASGDVSANTIPIGIAGRVAQVRLVPASGGTQPTDLYDVTLVDAASLDMLDGEGANQSNATGEYIVMTEPLYVAGGTLDIVVANAGNAKSGTVTIWVVQ